jgi:hypothetical protein
MQNLSESLAMASSSKEELFKFMEIRNLSKKPRFQLTVSIMLSQVLAVFAAKMQKNPLD